MYDIILINPTVEEYKAFKTRFAIAKKAESFRHAQRLAITEFFWVIWNDVNLIDTFEFSYVPDQWSKDYIHVFKNKNYFDGIILVPKNTHITDNEIKHRFFTNKKEVDIVASNPRCFDFFFVDNYNDYLTALENSKTEMFWVGSQNISHNKALITDFYISHHDAALRKQTHVFAHIVDESNYYNGLFLCSKHLPLSKKEVEYRFPVNRIEHTEIGSSKIKYDIFVIDSYQEYLFALENSKTEMFWGTSNNIDTTDFDFDTYFSHDNEYDRKTNHAFVHQVGGKNLYNGLFLFSKHAPVSKKEIEHRFIVNAKEWQVVASGPVKYEKFVIESYTDYLNALENSKTEMFWVYSNNLQIDSNFNFDICFSHDNEYDRKTNHAFIHSVDGNNLYNGVFLLSKHTPVTKREIEHRFIVNAKQWPVVASGPVKYEKYNINTYDEYLFALGNSKTEMFWGTSNNIDFSLFSFDTYFSHDNEYDRKTNHAFIHSVDGNNLYNGVFLFSRYTPVTKREIEHRFIVNAKQWPIVASGPVKYEKFVIENYNDYLSALTNSKTEMFWGTSNNIDTTDFNFDIYFSHDNEYDRKTNHAFVHSVDGNNLYNGVFLFSKQKKITEKELVHRFIVNAKQWPIVASGPVKYEKYNINTYEDYLNALSNSKTEMFWIVPDYVIPSTRFKFDTYFSHDNEYDRKTNHAFLNGKYNDGIVLCSKYSRFSKREFDYRFIANKKEVNIVISTPAPYDIVFISYQEPNADEYYKYLIDRFPRAKRIHGVKGIHQAHIEAAKLCSSDLFWIVDGDALIDSNFKFDYQVARWDRDMVHVWRSVNPINDLIYGYGGIKLFPTELTVNMDASKPDMTTSISNKFKAINEISNITAFNTDPFNTWKSAFRECVKLSSRVIDRQKDDETQTRLQTWCTTGADRPFGKYAIDGAKLGALFGARNKGNLEMLKNINNFDWLKEQFDARSI